MIRVPLYKAIPSSVTFQKNENKQNKNSNPNEYQDPLLKWPVRGLAYSNELGAALSEIAPTLGTLLWFPAMLYFGADFYDKYKNEQTSYNPNMQRGTKQVIFQSLASVIMPTAAVFAGQKTASAMGVMGKNGLSLQTQEEITNFIQKFISRRHVDKFINNKEEFKTHFVDSLTTKRENLIRNNKIKNPFQWIHDFLFAPSHPETIAISKKDKVLKFADNKIDEIFKIVQDLSQNQKPQEFSNNLWKKFQKLQEKYQKDPDYKDKYMRYATEDTIMMYEKNLVRKAKMLKTIGGFVALGIAIKPIDAFVENVIIKKYVDPNIDNVFQYMSHRNPKFLGKEK